MGWLKSSSTVQKQQLHAALETNLDGIEVQLNRVGTLCRQLGASQANLSSCVSKAASLGASIAANYGQRGHVPVHLCSIENQLQVLQKQAAAQLSELQFVEKTLIVARNDIRSTQSMINQGRTQRPGYQSATKLVEQALAGKEDLFVKVVSNLSGAEQQLRQIQGGWVQNDIKVTNIESRHNTLSRLDQNLVSARKHFEHFVGTSMEELLGVAVLGPRLPGGQKVKARAAEMLDRFEELKPVAQNLFTEIDFKLVALRNDLNNPQLDSEQFGTTVKQVEALFARLPLLAQTTAPVHSSVAQSSVLR